MFNIYPCDVAPLGECPCDFRDCRNCRPLTPAPEDEEEEEDPPPAD